jgi:hypothetical protein
MECRKNGIYSVKSAYRLISLSMRMLEQNKTNTANSSASKDNPFLEKDMETGNSSQSESFLVAGDA